jgi:hypothetical protein
VGTGDVDADDADVEVGLVILGFSRRWGRWGSWDACRSAPLMLVHPFRRSAAAACASASTSPTRLQPGCDTPRRPALLDNQRANVAEESRCHGGCRRRSAPRSTVRRRFGRLTAQHDRVGDAENDFALLHTCEVVSQSPKRCPYWQPLPTSYWPNRTAKVLRLYRPA